MFTNKLLIRPKLAILTSYSNLMMSRGASTGTSNPSIMLVSLMALTRKPHMVPVIYLKGNLPLQLNIPLWCPFNETEKYHTWHKHSRRHIALCSRNLTFTLTGTNGCAVASLPTRQQETDQWCTSMVHNIKILDGPSFLFFMQCYSTLNADETKKGEETNLTSVSILLPHTILSQAYAEFSQL